MTTSVVFTLNARLPSVVFTRVCRSCRCSPPNWDDEDLPALPPAPPPRCRVLALFCLLTLAGLLLEIRLQNFVQKKNFGAPHVPDWGWCDRSEQNCQHTGECALPWRHRRRNTTAALGLLPHDVRSRCCSDVVWEQTSQVMDILHQTNIGFFVSFGSLLGAVRDQDVIPHDADGDIMVHKSFYNESALSGVLNKRGYVIFTDGIIRICRKAKRICKNGDGGVGGPPRRESTAEEPGDMSWWCHHKRCSITV